MKNLALSLLTIGALTFVGCSVVENLEVSQLNLNSSSQDAHFDNTVGYIYTTTNGQSTNQVVSFARLEDGSLVNEIAYSTNSAGGADITAGGDARGDFDSQDAIQINCPQSRRR
jgi:hypothetical protein